MEFISIMTFVKKCIQNFKKGMETAAFICLLPFLPWNESYDPRNKYTLREYAAFALSLAFGLITFPVGAVAGLFQLTFFPFQFVYAKIRDIYSKHDIEEIQSSQSKVENVPSLSNPNSYKKDELKSNNPPKNNKEIEDTWCYDNLFSANNGQNKTIYEYENSTENASVKSTLS
jgi:hypothetical protein